MCIPWFPESEWLPSRFLQTDPEDLPELNERERERGNTIQNTASIHIYKLSTGTIENSITTTLPTLLNYTLYAWRLFLTD